MFLMRTADLPGLHDADSVGMRCPECARDRTRVKTIRTGPTTPIVTQVLIAINVLVFVAETATGTSAGRSQRV